MVFTRGRGINQLADCKARNTQVNFLLAVVLLLQRNALIAEFEMSGNGVGANNVVAVPRPLGAIAAEMPCLSI